MNNMLNYMKLNDISSKLKTDLLQDPIVNYDILHGHLKHTNKYVKFHKHRHNKLNG